MDDERRKAILLALACLAILILLIIECAIMPRMGWLWIITAALDLVLLAMCVRHIIRGDRKCTPSPGPCRPSSGDTASASRSTGGHGGDWMRRGSTGNAATCSPHAADPGTPTPDTAGRRTRSRPGTCSPAATRAAAWD